MPAGEFIEIFVDASLETCEKRDPKGLYKKARAGEIKNFTGISDPYEAPEKPELVLDSNSKSIEELSDEVIAYLEKKGLLSA
jgi:adenylylsulfate kinase